MKREPTEQLLLQENECFSNTGGTRDNNRYPGFQPAFRNDFTGDVTLPRFSDGSRAPLHLLACQPDDVARQRTAAGEISAIKGSAISGLVNEKYFYTRDKTEKISRTRH